MQPRAIDPAVQSLIEGLDDVTVLTGPGGREDRLVIDQCMGKCFDDVLKAYSEAMGVKHHEGGILPQAVGTDLAHFVTEKVSTRPLVAEIPDFEGRIVEIESPEGESGLAFLIRRSDPEEWRIDGFIWGCDLSVNQSLRGLGIGRMLVAAQLLHNGTLPTWEHDKPSYSHGGAMTVRSALRALQNDLAARARGASLKKSILGEMNFTHTEQEAAPCP